MAMPVAIACSSIRTPLVVKKGLDSYIDEVLRPTLRGTS